MDLPIAPSSDHEAPPLPVALARPERQGVPLVFVSAHSGREYPPAFLAAARLDALALRSSEDGFVDELFAAAPALGAPLLVATFPRAFCDANREPWELDPGHVRGAAAALGEHRQCPDQCGARDDRPRGGVRRGDLPAQAALCRGGTAGAVCTGSRSTRPCASWWTPPGSSSVVACWWIAIPCRAAAPHPTAPADFVLGDAHGTTCSPAVMRRAERALAERGYRVRRNDPYAGGYIIRHYGRPQRQRAGAADRGLPAALHGRGAPRQAGGVRVHDRATSPL